MKRKTVIITEFIISLVGIAFGAIFAVREYYVLCAVAFTVGAVTLIVGISSLFSDGEKVRLNAEYRRKNAVLSAPEIDFLAVIKSVVNLSRYEVLVQIPLVSLIDKVTNNSFRNELFRVIDYVIADRITYAPLLLIELNDASHKRADRAERDKKVSAICAAAKLPIIAFDFTQATDTAYVKKQINGKMLKK